MYTVCEYVHWSNYAEVATCDSKHRIRHVSSRVTGVSHVPQCHLIHKADPQLRAGKATIRFTSESLYLRWVGLDVPCPIVSHPIIDLYLSWLLGNPWVGAWGNQVWSIFAWHHMRKQVWRVKLCQRKERINYSHCELTWYLVGKSADCGASEPSVGTVRSPARHGPGLSWLGSVAVMLPWWEEIWSKKFLFQKELLLTQRQECLFWLEHETVKW